MLWIASAACVPLAGRRGVSLGPLRGLKAPVSGMLLATHLEASGGRLDGVSDLTCLYIQCLCRDTRGYC